MTLDEAIKHAEEVAEEKQLKANNLKQCKDYGNPKSTITSGVSECETCADEHRQLAEWLKDYKRLLEQNTVSEEVYTAEYNARKQAEYELWKIKEQQPCEDCVSRAEVDQRIYDYAESNGLSYANIKNYILDVSPVTPMQNWIPVSAKLPRENGWYQCTVILNDLPRTMELFYKNGKWLDNRRINMFDTYDIYGYGSTKEKHKLSYQELISEFEWNQVVIAWQPLSQPYEEKRSNENGK